MNSKTVLGFLAYPGMAIGMCAMLSACGSNPSGYYVRPDPVYEKPGPHSGPHVHEYADGARFYTSPMAAILAGGYVHQRKNSRKPNGYGNDDGGWRMGAIYGDHHYHE